MTNFQVVDIFGSDAPCRICGVDLLDINNIKYSGSCNNTETTREELCICRKCGTSFILKYNIFTEDGHIDRRMFSGDINDYTHNWQDNFTDKQKEKIGKHLKNCRKCSDNLEEETLADSWFSSLIHMGRDS